MCYLCFQNDPFSFKPVNDIHRKRQRILDIKAMLKTAEELHTCNVADITVKKLKEELYSYSREM